MSATVPTKAERRAYLLARGWTRIADTCWQHDRYGPAHFYTLAAAYRTEAATLANAEDGDSAQIADLLGVTEHDLPAELHRLRTINRRGLP